MNPISSKAAVIGGGIIGLSWAVVFARAGYHVHVHERAGRNRIPLKERVLGLAGVASQMGGRSAAEIAALCESHDDLAAVCANAVHVQEAVTEDLALKRSIYAEIDEMAPPEALIASSSSGLPISAIAGSLSGKERCIVLHPATPPHLLPVVEIVPAPFTPITITEKALALMRTVGMKPVLIKKERPGFVLNRLQVALLKEMFAAIAAGVISSADADSLICDGLGLRWAFLGPLEGIDLNAPGGISDYLRRYRALFDAPGSGVTGKSHVLTEPLIAELETSLRERFALSEHPARIAWRDRKISALRASKDGKNDA